MSEVIAASIVHADAKRFAISACSHDQRGDAIAFTGGTARSGAACPVPPVIVLQKPKLTVAGVALSFTLEAAEMGVLIQLNPENTTIVMQAFATYAAYWGLKAGDYVEINFLKTGAGAASTINIAAGGYAQRSTALSSAAIGHLRVCLYVTSSGLGAAPAAAEIWLEVST